MYSVIDRTESLWVFEEDQASQVVLVGKIHLPVLEMQEVRV